MLSHRLLWFSAFMAVSTVATAGAPAPVEVSFVKVDADRELLLYKVKINDAKPIRQVDIRFRYLDAAGKELLSREFLWQHNVKGTVQPIEKGKTYGDEDFGYPEKTTKAELKVTMVHYKDGTKWTPGK